MDDEESQYKWFFQSKSFIKACPKTTIKTSQHRLTGPECTDIRNLLHAVAFQHRPNEKDTWKIKMEEFIQKRLEKKHSEIKEPHTKIVFTNEQISNITKQWAQQNGRTLNQHGICEELKVTITKNKIAKSTDGKVEYEYRNGQQGTLTKIGETYVIVKEHKTNKKIKVKNTGIGNSVPAVKSALAITVDATQGKTIQNHVSVIIPDSYFPHPSKLLVAFSRSKSTSVNVQNLASFFTKLQSSQFDQLAVEYVKSIDVY